MLGLFYLGGSVASTPPNSRSNYPEYCLYNVDFILKIIFLNFFLHFWLKQLLKLDFADKIKKLLKWS